MKGVLTDFVPPSVMIESEDIPELFRRCLLQSHTATPHTLAREWIGRMNDVCNEDWGEDLKLSIDLATISTCELIDELKIRDAVREHVFGSKESYSVIRFDEDRLSRGGITQTGPSRILEVID